MMTTLAPITNIIANSNLFQILPLHLWQDNTARSHDQTDFEFIWVQDGSGRHCINGENIPLLPNSLYVALPRQNHKLLIQPKSQGYHLLINRSLLSEIFSADNELILHCIFSNSAELKLNSEQSRDMNQLLTCMYRDTTMTSANNRLEFLNSYMQIFLLHLKIFSEENTQELNIRKDTFLLNKFLSLLEIHFKSEKTVSFYARELCVTANYLSYTVKKTSGQTTSQLISHRVIQEAKRKALKNSASLKEVAHDLGFDDITHFSKFFKRICGVNYTVYKKNQGSHTKIPVVNAMV